MSSNYCPPPCRRLCSQDSYSTRGNESGRAAIVQSSQELQTWTAVSPSPLVYRGTSWMDNVPPQASGLILTQGRFAGDSDAPGVASGSTVSSHPRVEVIYSTNSSRWRWTNTSHGPWIDSGQIPVDIRTVTVHEVVHAAGLAHPWSCSGAVTASELASVMNAQWEVARRMPTTDDRAGFNALGY